MTIKTRFAPSPTGYLHIGGVRTALFSWLYARNHGGQFVVRIEDTDLERSTRAYVDAILTSIDWLGLSSEQAPVFQTKRFARYQQIIKQLLSQGDAYYCTCSRAELEQLREQQKARKEKPRYNGKCRHAKHPASSAAVVRFSNPTTGEVSFNDLVKGNITIANKELDDLIIARSDGTPTYNLTVVVDDMDMGITQVIRGDDHINNTPRQINILQALQAPLPDYAHVPMILGADGARLSKRHGATSVMQYRDAGYLPAALLNYLVRLGWSHGDQEIFSMDEMINLFELHKVNPAAAIFNPEKLLWLNHQYIMNSEPEQVAHYLQWHMDKQGVAVDDGPALVEIVKAQRERCKTLLEMEQASRYFYQAFEAYDEKAVKKNFKPGTDEILQHLLDEFSRLEAWDGEQLHQIVLASAAKLELKLGRVAQPLRVAITGTSVSPAIDITLSLLGREKTLSRMAAAITFIKEKNKM